VPPARPTRSAIPRSPLPVTTRTEQLVPSSATTQVTTPSHRSIRTATHQAPAWRIKLVSDSLHHPVHGQADEGVDVDRVGVDVAVHGQVDLSDAGRERFAVRDRWRRRQRQLLPVVAQQLDGATHLLVACRPAARMWSIAARDCSCARSSFSAATLACTVIRDTV
jgi:hypothetical protein